MKNVFYIISMCVYQHSVGFVKKKFIVYSTSFKYLRYKKVFIDKTQKTGHSDIKKLQNDTQIKKCPQKIFPERFSKKKVLIILVSSN